MNNRNDVNCLNKNAEPQQHHNNDRYKESVKFIRNLTDELAHGEPFNEKETYEFIKNFISEKHGLSRILYSELNKRIDFVSESQNAIDIMAQNAKTLFEYAKDKYSNISKDDEDCINIITKIFDHINLYIIQKERLNKQGDILKSEITKSVKEQAIKDIKTGIEREYITILSIFSAFILAFVGTLTYSSSILENIGKISFYKLLFICDIIGFFIYNTIFTLIWIIFKINGIKSISLMVSFIVINVIIIVFGCIIFILCV
jgi:hypothetical protein